MTVAEKIAQTMTAAPAIPRLGVPAYEWWSEALHGVARAGRATVFPQAIALAATFDEPLVRRVATVDLRRGAREVSTRRRRAAQHGRYQGLTFFSPNINIFRDPRWGRGHETFGEDPLLTARMGVAFITGMQGDDPRYLKTRRDREALRRPQRPRGRPAHVRRARQRARSRRHLPAAVRGRACAAGASPR